MKSHGFRLIFLLIIDDFAVFLLLVSWIFCLLFVDMFKYWDRKSMSKLISGTSSAQRCVRPLPAHMSSGC